MAVELSTFLSEQVRRLPESHPDRAFLLGLQQAVNAYAKHGTNAHQEAETPARRMDIAESKPQAAASDEPHSSEVAEGKGEPEGRRQAHQARVRVSGRVAARPDFRTTSKGIRRGHFPLATHPDADTTVYYEVYAFNKPGRPLADRLQELKLERGQQAEVIGYEHPATATSRGGKPRPKQIYAAAPIKAR